MKKPIRKILLCLLLLLVMGALLLWLNPSKPAFEGKVTKTDTAYALQLGALNGSDSHTLVVQAEDRLQVHFETTGGKLQLTITAPDGTALYEGNGQGVKDFTVTIP